MHIQKRLLCLVLVIVGGGPLWGCASMQDPGRIMTVYYGTDREPVQRGQGLCYKSERAGLSYGRCDVAIIPRSHFGAKAEASRTSANFAYRLVDGSAVRFASAKQFAQDLSPMLTGQDGILLFVHGYRMSFDDAARRTAQLAHDVGFDGVPMFFSWPSKAKFFGYFADEDSAEYAAPHLVEFLEQVHATASGREIHVIAHSMGAQLMVSAMRRLHYKHGLEARGMLDEVILAAADIDRDVLVGELDAVRPVADRLTLYCSGRDRALEASRRIHWHARAGEAGHWLLVDDRIDTVDASEIDTSLLGHSYYGDYLPVLADLNRVICNREPAPRSLLERKKDELPYWALQR